MPELAFSPGLMQARPIHAFVPASLELNPLLDVVSVHLLHVASDLRPWRRVDEAALSLKVWRVCLAMFGARSVPNARAGQSHG